VHRRLDFRDWASDAAANSAVFKAWTSYGALHASPTVVPRRFDTQKKTLCQTPEALRLGVPD
jgi:hypothetical protein